MNGKAKFPYFSADNYCSKWHKYNELVVQLEEDKVHSRKLEWMCCEIAHTGMFIVHFLLYVHLADVTDTSAGGSLANVDSDGDTSNDEDYGVNLD